MLQGVRPDDLSQPPQDRAFKRLGFFPSLLSRHRPDRTGSERGSHGRPLRRDRGRDGSALPALRIASRAYREHPRGSPGQAHPLHQWSRADIFACRSVNAPSGGVNAAVRFGRGPLIYQDETGRRHAPQSPAGAVTLLQDFCHSVPDMAGPPLTPTASALRPERPPPRAATIIGAALFDRTGRDRSGRVDGATHIFRRRPALRPQPLRCPAPAPHGHHNRSSKRWRAANPDHPPQQKGRPAGSGRAVG